MTFLSTLKRRKGRSLSYRAMVRLRTITLVLLQPEKNLYDTLC